ncbi:shikimate dehydrogenase [Phyllobacterium zundukense]|uniref:Shikimate dehydrogenase n=1 Tax=Phyllobacterium zundukense TaxID=1867719 RepID=A0A2N9VTM0_9HYPH|nr:shikimate dehydrogenase [Phyllobacterium zundukense]ATU93213.1 shikimate dehydrogenase [Phyllobacterium zundukense]PIO42838.1 shikimate dehydrogenase [Phyllobacterium zundukense]
MIHPERSRFLLGLVGAGIQASRTPPMHEREGDEQGFRLLYQSIDLEQLEVGPEALPELLIAAERMGFTGLNVTHPCKQAIIPCLDELSPDAAALGAVNTVGLSNGRRIGHNTDWWGFSESFKRGLPGAGLSSVVQLGAGGAGAAVAHALMTLGVRELVLSDRDKHRAEGVAAALNERFERFGAGCVRVSQDLATDMAKANGLVHCTPTGMEKYPGLPLPVELLHQKLWVAEIVYFPLETELLRTARRIGCRTLDGGGMAVFQAVEAFRLFTGVIPDHERMLRHFVQLGSGAKDAAA